MVKKGGIAGLLGEPRSGYQGGGPTWSPGGSEFPILLNPFRPGGQKPGLSDYDDDVWDFDYIEIPMSGAMKKMKKKKSKKRKDKAEGGLSGLLGERSGYDGGGSATKTNVLVKELYDAAGGFDGTGKTFSEFMADVLFEGDYLNKAEGGRIGLAEGDTPSEAWMRDYFYSSGKDRLGVITLDDYMHGPKGLGWKDYMEHGPGKAKGGRIGYDNGGPVSDEEKYEIYKNDRIRHGDTPMPFDTWKIFQIDIGMPELGSLDEKAEGGRIGMLGGGLLRTGIMEAFEHLTRRYGDDLGEWAGKLGDVRKFFTQVAPDKVDEIVKSYGQNRKIDLSKKMKEFLNNKIKRFKSELGDIKKYGQSGPVKEVGDHAEELKWLIRETKKDIKAVDQYGLLKQSQKATKHAEGGRIGFKDGSDWKPPAEDENILESTWKNMGPWEKFFWSMGLFPGMKEGGRIGFKDGKGPESMMRRRILQGIGALMAAAVTKVPGLKLLSKPVKDIGIKFKKQFVNDDVDYGTSGLMNFDLVGKTKAGKEFLKKFLNLKKGVSSFDDLEPAMAKKILKAAKKNKLSTSVDDLIEEGVSKVKGGAPDPTYYARPNWPDKILGPGKKVFKRFKERFNKQTTKENIDDFVQEGNWHYDNDKWRYLENLPGSTKIWSHPKARSTIKDIIDIIEPVVKKAEGGRMGLGAGGPPIQFGIAESDWKAKHPVQGNKISQLKDAAIDRVFPGTGITGSLNMGNFEAFYNQPLIDPMNMFEKSENPQYGLQYEKGPFEAGIGVMPSGETEYGARFKKNIDFNKMLGVHNRRRQANGGLTKTIPPKRGPMPQGLPSALYNGIMRPRSY